MSTILSLDDLVRLVAVTRCPSGGCPHCPYCAEDDAIHAAVVAFVDRYPDFRDLKAAMHRYLEVAETDPDQVARWATDGLPAHLLALLGLEDS